MRKHARMFLRFIIAVALGTALSAGCQREDGEPDPPLMKLVPCDPKASADDPEACPPDAAITDGGASPDARD
jgi:hypothetical protein